MRKITISLFSFVLGCQMVFSGINTNTNHSASWVRILARDASTSIDAVYYNPAGLVKLSDGFHFSINNQYISQNKTVTSNYPFLAYNTSGYIDGAYDGKVLAPLFPGIYLAYKSGGLVVSAGFNPIGGGGSATFDDGLPSLEVPLSDLIPGINSMGLYTATDYSVDASFEGTSAYMGYQAGVTYELNDQFSIYLGGRYVSAKNTYMGHLKDIRITVDGNSVGANVFFSNLASLASAGALGASTAATGMQPLIDGGAGGFTFAEAEAFGIIDATTRAQLEGGLTQLGIDPTGMTIAIAQGAYTSAATSLTTAAAEASATAVLVSDQEVDVEQTGWGFTTIIGFNYSPTEDLNIGVKYETATKIELVNAVNDGKAGLIGLTSTGAPVYMFPDGAKTRGDLPALLTVGVDYRIFSKLSASLGFHYYWDKTANYGKKYNGMTVPNDRLIDKNNWELMFGLEYDVTDFLALSAGYMRNQTGVAPEYQTDLSYSLNTNTFGGGAKFAINPKLALNIGFAYARYDEGEKDYFRFIGGDTSGTYMTVTESYEKDALIIGLGLDYSF